MIRFVEFGGYDRLADIMAEMAVKFAPATDGFVNVPRQMYDYVRTIPFRAEEVETLKAPAVTIRDGGDCDDKTILLCAWAIRRKIPCRIVMAGLSKRTDRFHHVFPEIKIAGEWKTFDATYDHCTLGERMKPYDYFKIMKTIGDRA